MTTSPLVELGGDRSFAVPRLGVAVANILYPHLLQIAGKGSRIIALSPIGISLLFLIGKSANEVS